MSLIKTKQGKLFGYTDILLFNVSNDNIVVIVNDIDQLNKFSLSGNSKDAPIAVIPYSEEELKKIVSYMKPIVGYTEVSPNKLSVEYVDDIKPYNTKVEFDSSNKEIIENNLIEQRKAKERNAVGNWYDTEENKDVSTGVTDEQRFKVLQIEKHEEQEEEYGKNISTSFFGASVVSICVILGVLMEEVVLSGVLSLSVITMIRIMAEEIANKVKISFRKDDLIKELSNAGVDIDMIRAAIENEEEKGKGAK